ncbi:MAG: class I SAM-dependent methyltransferase [Gemmataceae bacterium]|nr:class I SAM-dependent methyltransferase [Gemmataceae bacterium]
MLSVLNLGEQVFTGIFPRSKSECVPTGPLELLWCPDSGLLQLAHQFDLGAMYGDNYGYRSGLNQSMVRHLSNKANQLSRFVGLHRGDTVLDIGSNDGTLLNAYRVPGLRRIGIDPTGKKFGHLYSPDVELIPDFFSQSKFREVAGIARAKLITSIAMFYDLADPIAFVREIRGCLDDRGIWHFEQSYMPSMLRTNSYDTVCHEHIEYYSLSAVKKILDAADLELIDVAMNAVNGGSFGITAAKKGSNFPRNDAVIDWLLETESRMGLHTPRPFRNFEERVFEHRRSLAGLIHSLNAAGRKVFGYGASTKGNVLLQFCGLTTADIPCIADVNPDKHGCVTPGTNIPIVSEEEARAKTPDFFLVLPWHFKAGIIEREAEYLASGGHLIFPMPEIEIV